MSRYHFHLSSGQDVRDEEGTELNSLKEARCYAVRMIAEVLEGWSLGDVRRYTTLTERFVTDAITSTARMRERGLRP